MSIFDPFSRIYVINLPERKDRLQETLAELARAGLSSHDGRLHIFNAIRPDERANFPSKGAHGCFLSHLGIIEQALADQLENVLILEDDIALNDAALHAQPQLVARIRKGHWDFAYPGHHLEFPALHHSEQEQARWHTFATQIKCAHFYALHQRVMPSLLAFLRDCMQRAPDDPQGGPMHIDDAYNLFRQLNPRNMTLLAVPSLGRQRASRSDIFPGKWYDRIPLVRNIFALMRQWRNYHRRQFK